MFAREDGGIRHLTKGFPTMPNNGNQQNSGNVNRSRTPSGILPEVIAPSVRDEQAEILAELRAQASPEIIRPTKDAQETAPLTVDSAIIARLLASIAIAPSLPTWLWENRAEFNALPLPERSALLDVAVTANAAHNLSHAVSVGAISPANAVSPLATSPLVNGFKPGGTNLAARLQAAGTRNGGNANEGAAKWFSVILTGDCSMGAYPCIDKQAAYAICVNVAARLKATGTRWQKVPNAYDGDLKDGDWLELLPANVPAGTTPRYLAYMPVAVYQAMVADVSPDNQVIVQQILSGPALGVNGACIPIPEVAPVPDVTTADNETAKEETTVTA